MTIFSELAGQWHDGEQDVLDWFHRQTRHIAETELTGDTIAADHPASPAQGDHMSLAAIAADVRTAAENGVTEIRKLLDEHLPQIEALGEIVAANPVFASAEAASHVPLELLQGVATLLDTMAAAHPKPEAAPADQAPAEAVPQPA